MVHVDADVIGVGVVHYVGRADGEIVGVPVLEGQWEAHVLRGDVGHALPGRWSTAVQAPRNLAEEEGNNNEREYLVDGWIDTAG